MVRGDLQSALEGGHGLGPQGDEVLTRQQDRVVRRDDPALVVEQGEVVRGDAPVGGEGSDHVHLSLGYGLVHERGVHAPLPREGQAVGRDQRRPLGALEELVIAADLELLQGVDVAFTPGPQSMYPEGFDTHIVPGELASGLCGEHRPGHFRGVCTVVALLFRITRCEVAVFGEKDYQQLQIIRRMTEDLRLDVEIVGVPTVRDPDGLAMSSRNATLSASDRAEALVLSATLASVRDAVAAGEQDAEKLRRWAFEQISASGAVQIDYLSIVDYRSLRPITRLRDDAACLVAARVSNTRLIDNVQLPRRA